MYEYKILRNTKFLLRIVLPTLVLILIVESIIQYIQAESKVEPCITYNSFDNIITITCKFTNLTNVYHEINDDTILKKESDTIWVLNAELLIQNNSTFYINSTDTKWLKLNSDGINTSKLKSYGNLLIDSVKITSWNNTSNDYSTTNGDTPRSHITSAWNAKGKVDITNSEIAYLGYHMGGETGLTYINGGHNSTIKNNEIHHQWYGMYTSKVKGMTVENNHFHNNVRYGIDPHTETHHMIIRNNLVHDTLHKLGAGIICSLDCYDILIEDNEVYNNYRGIVLHRNTTNSIIQNNIVYNSFSGIEINESTNNIVINNSIHNNNIGIEIKFNETKIIPDIGKGFTASKNLISNNSILNSLEYGILLKNGASENIIQENLIDSAGKHAIHIKDEHSKNNLFLENRIINVNNPIYFENNTSSKFVNNTVIEKQLSLPQDEENSFIVYYMLLIIAVLIIAFVLIFIYSRKKKYQLN